MLNVVLRRVHGHGLAEAPALHLWCSVAGLHMLGTPAFMIYVHIRLIINGTILLLRRILMHIMRPERLNVTLIVAIRRQLRFVLFHPGHERRAHLLIQDARVVL